ncbi:hypothetical protein EVAR_79315_1 [Eumeta japonica]|uniref:Uncharacterized protein n=1 Tax=Eumeta variegata TaxID=151549 RepID=A0A4C1TEP5_EUMVA|nr:hypothetical protein EVAR_79315_1 [Eumeta japonica]
MLPPDSISEAFLEPLKPHRFSYETSYAAATLRKKNERTAASAPTLIKPENKKLKTVPRLESRTKKKTATCNLNVECDWDRILTRNNIIVTYSNRHRNRNYNRIETRNENKAKPIVRSEPRVGLEFKWITRLGPENRNKKAGIGTENLGFVADSNPRESAIGMDSANVTGTDGGNVNKPETNRNPNKERVREQDHSSRLEIDSIPPYCASTAHVINHDSNHGSPLGSNRSPTFNHDLNPALDSDSSLALDLTLDSVPDSVLDSNPVLDLNADSNSVFDSILNKLFQRVVYQRVVAPKTRVLPTAKLIYYEIASAFDCLFSFAYNSNPERIYVNLDPVGYCYYQCNRTTLWTNEPTDRETLHCVTCKNVKFDVNENTPLIKLRFIRQAQPERLGTTFVRGLKLM